MGVTVFFGGTFNPPHLAHRKMLEAVCALPQVERVLVAPTNIPPHKEVAEAFASAENRLFMCRLLCDGLDKAEVSDIEFKRDGKSYSFYTLSQLKRIYPDLAMIIGGDMVTSFTNWYNYKEVLKLAQFILVRRKGIDNAEFDKCVEGLKNDGGNISVVEIDLPQVSSTEIRKLLESNGDLSKLLPKNIAEYIENKGLYR